MPTLRRDARGGESSSQVACGDDTDAGLSIGLRQDAVRVQRREMTRTWEHGDNSPNPTA